MKRTLKSLADLEALENGAVGELFRQQLARVMADVVVYAASAD